MGDVDNRAFPQYSTIVLLYLFAVLRDPWGVLKSHFVKSEQNFSHSMRAKLTDGLKFNLSFNSWNFRKSTQIADYLSKHASFYSWEISCLAWVN